MLRGYGKSHLECVNLLVLKLHRSFSDVFSELCWKDERTYSRFRIVALGRGIQLEQETSRSHVEAVI